MKEQQFDGRCDASNIRNPEPEQSIYQLLGLQTFESNPDKIATAFANLSHQLDVAKAVFSNEEAKKEYDEHLIRTGFAGLPRLGFWGGSAIFFSFVLSIAIVFTMTFYIYPIIVPKIPEPIGDSITTVAGYTNLNDENQWKELKAKQQDLMTMDVNIDIPITVDEQFEDELIESETDVKPAITVPAEAPATVSPQSATTLPGEPSPVEPVTTLPVEPVTTEEQPIEVPEVPPFSAESIATPKPESTPIPIPESQTSDQSAEPGLLDVPDVPTASTQTKSELMPEVPVTEQPSVPTVDESVLPSVPLIGTQTLTSPKQLPNSIVNAIAESAKEIKTKQQLEQLIQDAKKAEDNLIKNKEFVFAEQIADIVYKACLISEGKPFRVEALRHKEKLSLLTKQWIAVSTAQVQFAKVEDKTQPCPDADIIASWVIGIDNDWDSGLQYLLANTDQQIRSAAEKEKNIDESNVDSCIAVADAWWNVSQTPSVLQKQFRNRSGYWYTKALPSVTDKNMKTLIEKRLTLTK